MIIITGASSGLGKAIYKWLKITPKPIVGVSRHGPDYTTNLSDSMELHEFLTWVKSHTPIVNILINNAGTMEFELETLPGIKNREMLNTNLIAPLVLMNGLETKFTKGSCIINIASVSGIKGEADAPLYAATKAGLLALTKSYAKKFAPRGIRVNAISPGFFKTNLVPGDTPQELIDTVPLKREASPEEIIPAVEMILKSKYMTGANIVVDGGVLL